MADPIRVNNALCWGSIAVKIAGDLMLGYTEITYGDKRSRPLVYAGNQDQGPIGKTLGKYEVDESKIKGLQHSIQLLRARLAELDPQGGNSTGNYKFDVIITIGEDDLTTHVVELRRCNLTADTTSLSEGADPNYDELTFQPEEIVRDGATLRNSRGVAP